MHWALPLLSQKVAYAANQGAASQAFHTHYIMLVSSNDCFHLIRANEPSAAWERRGALCGNYRMLELSKNIWTLSWMYLILCRNKKTAGGCSLCFTSWLLDCGATEGFQTLLCRDIRQGKAAQIQLESYWEEKKCPSSCSAYLCMAISFSRQEWKRNKQKNYTFSKSSYLAS